MSRLGSPGRQVPVLSSLPIAGLLQKFQLGNVRLCCATACCFITKPIPKHHFYFPHPGGIRGRDCYRKKNKMMRTNDNIQLMYISHHHQYRTCLLHKFHIFPVSPNTKQVQSTILYLKRNVKYISDVLYKITERQRLHNTLPGNETSPMTLEQYFHNVPKPNSSPGLPSFSNAFRLLLHTSHHRPIVRTSVLSVSGDEFWIWGCFMLPLC